MKSTISACLPGKQKGLNQNIFWLFLVKFKFLHNLVTVSASDLLRILTFYTG